MAIADQSDGRVDEYTARRITAVCEHVLVRAGVAGVLPTPLDSLGEAAGIVETLDIGQVPVEAESAQPSWLKRVIGAYAYNEKVVFVDRAQTQGRARFTQAHETTHAILPWHHATYTFDDETIFQDTQARLDAEANLGAGYLVFQGDRFRADALNYETRLASAIAMSERYGASAHATIRYFALHHADAVGLLVCGRFPLAGRRLPVWFPAESDSFRQRFGGMANRVRTTGRNRYVDEACEPLRSIALAALETGVLVSDQAKFIDGRGKEVPLWADAWFNQFNVFVMVSPRYRIRRGRRVAVGISEGDKLIV